MTEPWIDRATFDNLKEMVGADFIIELLDTFFEDTPKLVAEMHQALAAVDAEAFRRAAHSFKSTSASFGALQLSSLARELEYMGRDGQLEGANAKLESLEAAYEQTQIALKVLQNES